jgi:glyoxylase-like metal-dependent hydrolase (beta-lactamase superfamily II)
VLELLAGRPLRLILLTHGHVDHAGAAAELRRALAVAERCAGATGGRVETVREITPSDFELRLWPAGAELPVVLHLRPEPTTGERYWLERIARGEAQSPWADLRWDDRVVLGGVG